MEVEEEDQTNVASNKAEGSNRDEPSNNEGIIASLNDAAGAVAEQEEARKHQEHMEAAAQKAEEAAQNKFREQSRQRKEESMNLQESRIEETRKQEYQT